MKNILEKLSKEELKQLSKSINENQSNIFGKPLSLRKQENLMAKIFGVKNWSTALGLCNKKTGDVFHGDIHKSLNSSSNLHTVKSKEIDKTKKVFGTKTIFTYEVLTEKDHTIPRSLEDVAYETSNGYCVGRKLSSIDYPLSKKEMAKALIEAGSEPEFFCENLSVDVMEIMDIAIQSLLDDICELPKKRKIKSILSYIDNLHKTAKELKEEDPSGLSNTDKLFLNHSEFIDEEAIEEYLKDFL